MMSQAQLTAALADNFQMEADEAQARGEVALARVLFRRAEEWRELAAEQAAAVEDEADRFSLGDQSA